MAMMSSLVYAAMKAQPAGINLLLHHADGNAKPSAGKIYWRQPCHWYKAEWRRGTVTAAEPSKMVKRPAENR